MKTLYSNLIVIFVLSIISNPLFAQTNNTHRIDIDKIMVFTDGDYHFTEVVSTDGISSNDLFANAITWVSKLFSNPKSVIQLQDKDAGLLVIKGISSQDSISTTSFKLTIQVKDGRYKYDLSDIITAYDFSDIGEAVAPTRMSDWLKNNPTGWKSKFNNEFGTILRSLKKEMSATSNW